MDLAPIRQHSSHGLKALTNQGTWLIAITHLLLLPPAIACLAVTITHDEHSSTCTEQYIVDLNHFLEITGFLQIAAAALSFSVVLMNLIQRGSITLDVKCTFLVYIPYGIWAAIGLYIWVCQHSLQFDAIPKYGGSNVKISKPAGPNERGMS